jgi:hypothetical protein
LVHKFCINVISEPGECKHKSEYGSKKSEYGSFEPEYGKIQMRRLFIIMGKLNLVMEENFGKKPGIGNSEIKKSGKSFLVFGNLYSFGGN